MLKKATLLVLISGGYVMALGLSCLPNIGGTFTFNLGNLLGGGN